ncbi:Sporulation kinase A [Maioricimonas rarisocia]|uniref:histidine kinase n=1 Tax=Maioricimonas rarisocia TaxID=2528026 RepID=A0A517Z684_9PLAN|nr:HAMP domain-containing sensor histidine kinase [Maioricimonas rarisocia]QDU37939.1 Sporulation kinase A [Maioricimonas rarisocia]
MRWPIRNQILFPLAGVVVVGVALTTLTTASVAARQSEQATIGRLRQVVETLGDATIPFTPRVLEQMRGLSGAEFIALGPDGDVRAATLPYDLLADWRRLSPKAAGDLASLTDSPPLLLAGERYFAAELEVRPPAVVRRLVILSPERNWQTARRDAVLPPLIVGGVTIGLMLIASIWLSGQMSRRIQSVETQVERIAQGEFVSVAVKPPDDELHALASSVNHMSASLQQLQESMRRTERMRLLAQLGSGLAHQLRNSVTGARMAVQLHRRRCSSEDGDESLAVALDQLTMTEEQIRSLLTVGRGSGSIPVTGPLSEIIHDVCRLITSASQHAGRRFHPPEEVDTTVCVADFEGTRAALLNLLTNGLEAAGNGGDVALEVALDHGMAFCRVSDSGPGPDAEIADRLLEPFVTTKPEGVGLGLAMARTAAESQGGELTWERCDDRTVFTMTVPATWPSRSSQEKGPRGASEDPVRTVGTR